MVTPGAVAEIQALRAAGFTLRCEPARHDGQGTASVAVYFQNAYLELIWVDTSVSVQPEHTKTLEWFRKASSWRTSAFRGLRPKGLETVRAQPPVLDVHLDHGIRNERLDLRPTLPLVIVR